ncbi:MAG: hypothetical protein U1F77_17520 [Kiritimatiellia bacterium]
MRRGELAQAETHFRNAIARLTRRNANPADGEAYNAGVAALPHSRSTRRRGRPVLEQAYAAFLEINLEHGLAGPRPISPWPRSTAAAGTGTPPPITSSARCA